MSDETSLISTVYEDLLQVLVLEPHHEKQLKHRGYTADEIVQSNIKTLPRATKSIVSKLVAKHGDELRHVPGFFKMNGKEWSLSASSCMMIPIMSPHGEISGIKLCSDKEGLKKYFLLSSAKATGSSNDTCGTSAKPEPHYPTFSPEDPQEGVIRITEGEHKANLATINSDVYTISVPGVNFWQKILPYIRDAKPNKVLIAFDSDKSDSSSTSVDSDEEFKVGKELSKLYNALKSEGFNAVIEDWDAMYGKGIDDVLVDGNGDKIIELTDIEADKFCAEKLANQIDSEWVYIIKRKSFLNTTNGVEFDKEQYDDYMTCRMDDKGKPSTKFIQDPSTPKFTQCVYHPQFPSVVEYNGHPCYNTWRDPKITPVEGDCSIFLDHINYLLPDETESNILLDFLAHQIQKPGHKMSWAILIQGGHGIGKSYLGYLLGSLLGEENVGRPSNDVIKSQFTKWQLNKSVIVIEELMGTGRVDFANKLKPMISERIATIREMRVDEYTVPNTYNIIAFTNHRDSIMLEDGDRRYCVLFSPAKSKGRTYYDTLFDWTEKNYPCVLDYLMKRDISSFNAKGRAPDTDAKSEMIDLSMSAHEEFVRDSIANGEVPFTSDIVCVSDIAAYVNKRFKKSLTARGVANIVAKYGGEALGQYRLDRKRKSLTAIRDVDKWKLADNDVILKSYLDGTNMQDPYTKDGLSESDENRRQSF